MNVINYSKEMEKTIASLGDNVPTLLLHSCCAPCSSTCLEILSEHFKVSVLYYNPNITDSAEYNKRLAEEKRFIDAVNNLKGFDKSGENNKTFFPISLTECTYDPMEFFEAVKGYENCPEGGERCFICYEMRLREAASTAKREGFDYFTTTLTLSPLKNAAKLNEIGQKVASEYEVKFLPSDFKKKDGYKRSIQLSKDFELYRQNYCGCIFSKNSCSTTCDITDP